MNKQKINEIFNRFSESKAAPKIELIYSNPFMLLVAIVLSAQSTDKGVNKVTPSLFDIAPTPKKMIVLGEEKLKNHIKSIGLYNAKARNIIALSKIIINEYNGQVPNNLIELLRLPGVGRKSANVLLNTFWNEPTIAVDTHVFRVSNRIGLCKTSNPLQTELALLKVIPDQWKTRAHHWLVLHGRYTCKARKPECGRCIIVDICKYKNKNL